MKIRHVMKPILPNFGTNPRTPYPHSPAFVIITCTTLIFGPSRTCVRGGPE